MDANDSGLIEYKEFAAFYRSQDEQTRKKIVALKAEAELLRRLEGGALTDSEEEMVRARLSLPAV